MNFTASLRSELLKIKGTSVIYLVLIAALVIPFVMVYDHDAPGPNQSTHAWDYFYKDGLKVFVFAFLPLFCVLASTLLIQIEVRNNTWKQVLASPQSFFNILFAKFAVLQLLVIAFMLTYNVYVMLGAMILDTMNGSNLLTYLDR